MGNVFACLNWKNKYKDPSPEEVAKSKKDSPQIPVNHIQVPKKDPKDYTFSKVIKTCALKTTGSLEGSDFVIEDCEVGEICNFL
jgi:hypothetical protein